MPTPPVALEHDEVRNSSADNDRATAESEPNHPVADPDAAGVESPSAEQMQGANGSPRQSSPDGETPGLPRDTNADDTEPGASDQDIDIAGTEADESSESHSALGLPRSDASPAKDL